MLGLTPGEGIFASIDTGSGSRKITRIAGVAGNGHLDPGETHEDANNNGKVDLGEDKGLLSGFAKDERVGVSYRNVGDKNLGTVAYLAFNNGQESLLSSQFEVSASDSQITHLQSNIVAKVGASANLVSPALTGVIQDLNIYDPVNNLGKVAFWVKTSTEQEAIVRANPVLKPILLVPGIGATFPKDNFKDWIMNRGVQPNTLRADPLGLIWEDLVETLKRAGYVEGVNLFVAQTEAGPGSIEVEGFLAKGEQKTFDIPINNAPILDLNGSTEGIDFSTTGTLGATITLVDPSLVVVDSDSPNLQGATITLTNPTNGTQESLKATSVGNITVAYDPATHTLTLEGTDTIANYQQVLKAVTYTNTATTLNSVPREIAFVVDDGVEFNNLSAVAKTTLTLTAPTPPAGKIIKGTSGRDTLVGTNGNDVIIGFQQGDKLTGKGGNDQFVYKTLKDGIDTITDFEVGKDKIVLTEVLKKLGYKGSDPLGDGRVQISSQRGQTFLRLDPDGFAGKAQVQTLAQVTG